MLQAVKLEKIVERKIEEFKQSKVEGRVYQYEDVEAILMVIEANVKSAVQEINSYINKLEKINESLVEEDQKEAA